jgi:hypothetical protein
VLAVVVVRIYVTRCLVLELKTTLFQCLDDMFSVTEWDENIVCKVCGDEEYGSTIQSAITI